MKGMVEKKLPYEFNENMWAKFYDHRYFSANFLSIDDSKAVSMICKRSFYVKEEFSPRISSVSMSKTLGHECCIDFQEGAAGTGADHVFIPTSAGPPVTSSGLPVSVTSSGLPVTSSGLPVTSSGLPVTSSGLPVTLVGRPVIMTSEAVEGGGDEVALPPPNLIPIATSLLKPGGRYPTNVVTFLCYLCFTGKQSFIIADPDPRTAAFFS
jgi:hypothetical protein